MITKRNDKRTILRIGIAAVLLGLLVIISLFCGGCAAADAVAGSETEVIVTSPATVGIVTLTDTEGNTITTGMIGPGTTAAPVTLTYNPAEHQLSSISIMGAGYFPASVSAENPPAGCSLSVEFTLSGEDENAGYGTVTVITPESSDGSAAKTPAPIVAVFAGLCAVACLFVKKRA